MTDAMENALRIRNKGLIRLRVADVLDAPWNFRRHPDAQRDALQGSINGLGFYGYPDVYRTETGAYRLTDGHLRKDLLIAKYGADTEIEFNETDFDEAEAKEATLTKDPLAALAQPDPEALDRLLREVNVGDEALAKMLADLASEAGLYQAPEVVEDEVPEVPKVPVTKPGDLWLLGEHRLLCGDSTCEADVARVMNGNRAGLMNTDPPYGVAYANDERPNPGVAKPRVAKPRVANDGPGGDELQAFLESAFRPAVANALRPDAAWYLWHANLTEGFFTAAAAAAAANVMLHRTIIWVKPVLLLGRGQYHWKHEPCFMGWVTGHQPPDYGLGNGERTQTTVWEMGTVTHAERKEFDHSTPKPVGLFSIPIVKHLKPGEWCYEPFAGSGPQIIAAEQLGRRCAAVEIDPRFCDVIVERWSKLTGQSAVLEAR